MEPSEEDKDKLFFTTTDLLSKINSVIQENQEESSSEKGGFELQRRLPDGSTRLCTKDEAAAADFQAKLKQVRMFRKNLFVSNFLISFISLHIITRLDELYL